MTVTPKTVDAAGIVPDVAPVDADAALIAERRAIPLAELLARKITGYEEAARQIELAAEADALFWVRVALGNVDGAATMAVASAQAAVERAEALTEALVEPDAAVVEADRRIADLEAAIRAAFAASDFPDLSAIKALRDDVVTYQAIADRLRAKRVGPADQLVAAERESRDARAAAVAAVAAAEAKERELLDPLHVASPARAPYVLATVANTILAVTNGGDVHPMDAKDAELLVLEMADALGLLAAEREVGRREPLPKPTAVGWAYR